MQRLTGISTSELEARRARLLEHLEHRRLTGCVLFDEQYIRYFTSVYDAELGGFRHSDTVVVTPDGIETLTSYPRDIESLTIPA